MPELLRAVSFLLCEHGIVPEPTACILPAQGTKSPPETRGMAKSAGKNTDIKIKKMWR